LVQTKTENTNVSKLEFREYLVISPPFLLVVLPTEGHYYCSPYCCYHWPLANARFIMYTDVSKLEFRKNEPTIDLW